MHSLAHFIAYLSELMLHFLYSLFQLGIVRNDLVELLVYCLLQ